MSKIKEFNEIINEQKILNAGVIPSIESVIFDDSIFLDAKLSRIEDIINSYKRCIKDTERRLDELKNKKDDVGTEILNTKIDRNNKL